MKPRANGDPSRRNIAARRVGIGSKCKCGENRPLALIAGTNPTICAECRRRAQGRATYDQHHPAGDANHRLTVPIPVNDHRAVLSEAQYEWPKRTLENPDASPLRAAAASIRGYVDLTHYLLDELLLPNAERLEALDAAADRGRDPKTKSLKTSRRKK
jgi:hypothetical protein